MATAESAWLELLSHLEKSATIMLNFKILVFQKTGHSWSQKVTEEEQVRILLVADVTLPNHAFLLILSSQITPRLLMDYLEDFCDDDGFIFCHCQVSHFKSCVVILLMYSY